MKHCTSVRVLVNFFLTTLIFKDIVCVSKRSRTLIHSNLTNKQYASCFIKLRETCFFFQEALGKRQVITPSFTLFEKEKSQQIIAKKNHTVLSTFSALVKIQVS